MVNRNDLLDVSEVDASYGDKPVLRKVTLHVSEGETVAILGPNGAGKSTLLKTIFGLLRPSSGRILYRGEEITYTSSNTKLNRGIAYVMQGNRVFDALTVEENLEVAAIPLRDSGGRVRIESVFQLFPVLRHYRNQRASTLSAGEKQMLALARGMVPEPKLLLLDEPTSGLAPRVISETLMQLHELCRKVGTSVVVVEQNVNHALKIADRAYVLRLGEVVYHGLPSELNEPDILRDLFLGKRERVP